MAGVYVSVGSNIEPVKNIRAAMTLLKAHYPVLRFSSVYESEAVGFSGDNFYNFVVAFETKEDVMAVVRVLRAVEDQLARDRSGPRFSARRIDLDLLLYDDLINRELNVPRDEILTNAFVLQPLAELGPEISHPETEATFQSLWQAFDQTSQSLWKIEFNW